MRNSTGRRSAQYFTLSLRDHLADTPAKGEKAELTANQWSPLTVGRLASVIAVAEAKIRAA